MNIEYMREFVVLAQTGRFQDAAKALFISQPTLSKHIRQMESELGADLFLRTPQSARLTEFGRELLPCAIQIADVQEEYTAIAKRRAREEKEIVIHLSADAVFYTDTVLELVSLFRDCRRLRVEVSDSGLEMFRDLLRLGRCDVAILCERPEREADEFCRIELLADRLAAVLPHGHPLCGEARIPAVRLRGETLIQAGEHSLFAEMAQAICRDAGFEAHSRFLFGRGDLQFHLIAQGFGAALFPERAARDHAAAHPGSVGVVALEEAPSLRLNLLYPDPVKHRVAETVAGILYQIEETASASSKP